MKRCHMASMLCLVACFGWIAVEPASAQSIAQRVAQAYATCIADHNSRMEGISRRLDPLMAEQQRRREVLETQLSITTSPILISDLNEQIQAVALEHNRYRAQKFVEEQAERAFHANCMRDVDRMKEKLMAPKRVGEGGAKSKATTKATTRVGHGAQRWSGTQSSGARSSPTKKVGKVFKPSWKVKKVQSVPKSKSKSVGTRCHRNPKTGQIHCGKG